MPDVSIENPIINSPFEEPVRQFRDLDDGITDEIIPGRRRSTYLIAAPPPKQRGKQLALDPDMTEHRRQGHQLANDLRAQLIGWRKGSEGTPRWNGVKNTTRRLLEHWTDPGRERRLFFCQIEALETIIYLTEVAGNTGRDANIKNRMRQANAEYNAGLARMALKMATGSGKTLVMAMLIAWHTLNKVAAPKDSRFSDTFLTVTPGITIRDRLRVLLPNDPENYYAKHDLVPPELRPQLSRATIHITNYHAFIRREKVDAGKLTKQILKGEDSEAFRETPEEMVNRVCRGLGDRNIVVLNDEAHHCYRPKHQNDGEKLSREERTEAKKRDETARVWMSGLEAVNAKLGIGPVYDLSATPFFLSGSGYGEGVLFPWVVMDFSLIDAIECGIVKVPRVPVLDNTVQPDGPVHRYFWTDIRDQLPRPSDVRKMGREFVEPALPDKLESALLSLYGDYERQFEQWQQARVANAQALQTPPVFIVVCSNTAVSKLVYDYIGGHEKPSDGSKDLDPEGDNIIVPGKLPLLSNVDEDKRWLRRPVTLLIDSEQLESGDALSADFKKLAALQIEEFKADYRRRYPDRDASSIDDADILREVMNTVGKPGKLGEHVRCVVSVSMLTEGWDANTVTHILGVRAFGTQLLCEQVVGRGLRRRSYAQKQCTVTIGGREETFDGFPTEYAEIYGVPFRFIPTSGDGETTEPPPTYEVKALPERAACAIEFPRVVGYRYDLPEERLCAEFAEDSRKVLTTAEIPTWTESAPIIGESSVQDLDELKHRRPREVEFLLAKLLLERYFRDDENHLKPWLFPQLLRITRRWLAECVECGDDCFPQMLLLLQPAYDAADRIHRAIVGSYEGQATLKPTLSPYSQTGDTHVVDFETTRPVFDTDPSKSHVNRVVADTAAWEQHVACKLEHMDEVKRYVKR